MRLHCDALDGPVVGAARQALAAFDWTMAARAQGGEAQELADRWFFETVVRVHRAGEGAPFGAQAGGARRRPGDPCRRAGAGERSDIELATVLCDEVREQVQRRLQHALWLKSHAGDGLDAARASTEAALGLQVWAHSVHKVVVTKPHAHGLRALWRRRLNERMLSLGTEGDHHDPRARRHRCSAACATGWSPSRPDSAG